MRVNIDFDTLNPQDLAALRRVFEQDGDDAAPARKRAPKPVTPISGSPDAAPGDKVIDPVKQQDAPAAQTAAAPAATVETVAATTGIKLADDTPDVVKVLLNQVDRETLGTAILRCSKTVAEGGRGRDVAVGIIEKYRPAGNTDKPKLGILLAKDYPAVAKDVLAAYAAA